MIHLLYSDFAFPSDRIYVHFNTVDDIILVLEERGGFILGIKFIKLNNYHSGVVGVYQYCRTLQF